METWVATEVGSTLPGIFLRKMELCLMIAYLTRLEEDLLKNVKVQFAQMDNQAHCISATQFRVQADNRQFKH